MLLNLFDDKPLREKAKLITLYTILIAANIASWIWAWVAFANRPALLGTALLAYIFGLRHAFDADHIAAIDNVVRKLMQDGKAPYATGFFFSLGHSTIVVIANIVIAVTAASMHDSFDQIHKLVGMIGTIISALFLLIIGVANLLMLRGIWAAFTSARSGQLITEESLAALLPGKGVMTRIFQPLFRGVSRSWHMYPIGFLFGLGFDTATEIGLLGISSLQAAQGMSFWTILVFPAMFTAGMSLMDTTDSVLMTRAYAWAFIDPVRKLWYNLTMTAASIAVALFIGGIEALGLIADKLGLQGQFWSLVSNLNDNLTQFGLIIVGIFIASWVLSGLVYKAKGYDRPQPSKL